MSFEHRHHPEMHPVPLTAEMKVYESGRYAQVAHAVHRIMAMSDEMSARYDCDCDGDSPPCRYHRKLPEIVGRLDRYRKHKVTHG